MVRPRNSQGDAYPVENVRGHVPGPPSLFYSSVAPVRGISQPGMFWKLACGSLEPELFESRRANKN